MRIIPCFVALLAVAASAQPTYLDTRGVFVVAGNASPERLLFPIDTDPMLSVGALLSGHVDVHIGYGSGEIETFGPSRVPPDPDQTTTYRLESRTRALSLSSGYTRRVGRPLVEVRASVTYDAHERRRQTREITPDAPALSPGSPVLDTDTVERETGRFVHTGGSVVLSLPLGFGSQQGRISPGIGLAVSASTPVGGTLDAQDSRWMPFLRLPTTVRIRDRVSVTIEAKGGIVQDRLSRGDSDFDRWVPVVDGALRVNL